MNLIEIINDTFDLFDEPITSGTLSRYSQDNNVLIKRIINRVYSDICKRTLCSRGVVEVTVPQNTRVVGLPDEAEAVKRVEAVNDWNRERIPLSPIYESAAVDVGGFPYGFYTYKDSGSLMLGINPTSPESDRFLSVEYFRKPLLQLVEDTDVPVLIPDDYHWLISYGAVTELFRVDKSEKTGGYQKWLAFYEQGVNRLKTETLGNDRGIFKHVN